MSLLKSFMGQRYISLLLKLRLITQKKQKLKVIYMDLHHENISLLYLILLTFAKKNTKNWQVFFFSYDFIFIILLH